MSDETLRRRELLQRSAAVAAVGLVSGVAGCAGTVGHETTKPAEDHPARAQLKPSLPVKERSTVTKEGVEQGRKAQISSLKQFESALADFGVTVATVESSRELATLKQMHPVVYSRENGILRELGTVSGGYAALVQTDDAPAALAVSVLNENDREIGSYYVATEWAAALLDDSLSVAGYSEKVVGTLKTT